MSEKAKNVIYIINQFKKNLKKIVGHPILGKDEYVKDLYLTVLSSIVFTDGSIEKKEIKFLMSLQNAFGLKGEIFNFFNKANNVDENKIQEFITCIIKENLQFNFILDALLAIRLEGTMNEEEVSIVGELAEVLNIGPKEMEFLCELAVVILEENSKKFNIIIKNRPDKILSKYFRPYVVEFLDVFLIEDTKFQGENEFTGNLIVNNPIICSGNIKIKDAKINFGKEGKLIFRTGAELYIEESEFINAEIVCEDLNSLNIKSSTFKNCENKRPLFIYQCHKDVLIKNSTFENCTINKEDNGGAIKVIDSSVEMTGLIFNNCKTFGCGGALYIKEKHEFYESTKINDLQFNFCSAKNGGGMYIEGTHSKHISQYSIFECIFNNCKSELNGGGAYIDSLEAYKQVIFKSEFNSCEASEGGGVYLQVGNIETSIMNCRFDTCKSESKGSALFIKDYLNNSEGSTWNVTSNCEESYNF